MPQDSESVWKSEFKDLPLVETTVADGMTNFANFVNSRVSNKLSLSSPLTGSSIFTFNSAAFLGQIISLQPVADPSGLIAIANAWQTSALSSTMVTLPGAYIGSPTPATTFSVVQLTVIDPASVAAAYASLLSSLLDLQPVEKDPIFPVLFRDAFAGLKFNVTGLNSVPPPAGPVPLVATFVPVA